MLQRSYKTILFLMMMILGFSLVACSRERGYSYKLDETTILYQDTQDMWHPLIDVSLLKGVDDIALFSIETEDGVLYWRYDGSERNKLIDSQALKMLEEGRFNDETVLIRVNEGVYQWREAEKDDWHFLFDTTMLDTSIIVPEDTIGNLPARVPLLENFNLMDGTRYVEDKPVDFERFHEKSGLYLPKIYEHQLDGIDISSLKNTEKACDDFHEDCKGGVFEATLTSDNELEFYHDVRIAFDEIESATLEISVASLSKDATLEVGIIQGGLILDIGSIDEAGTYSFAVETEYGGKLRMVLKGESGASVELMSVVITNRNDAVVSESYGYTFNQWKLAFNNGTLARKYAVLTVASYFYNPYKVGSIDIDSLYAPFGTTPNRDHRIASKGVSEVIVSGGVTVIPSYAFSGFEALERVVLSDSVALIAHRAFSDTPVLRKVHLPTSLEIIQEGAFANSGIEAITLPEGLEKIETAAFSNSGLKRVVIPSSIASIAMMAFTTASPLQEIVFERPHTDGFVEFTLMGMPSVTMKLSDVFYVDETTRIFVPDDSVNAYKAHYPDYADLIFPHSYED